MKKFGYYLLLILLAYIFSIDVQASSIFFETPISSRDLSLFEKQGMKRDQILEILSFQQTNYEKLSDEFIEFDLKFQNKVNIDVESEDVLVKMLDLSDDVLKYDEKKKIASILLKYADSYRKNIEILIQEHQKRFKVKIDRMSKEDLLMFQLSVGEFLASIGKDNAGSIAYRVASADEKSIQDPTGDSSGGGVAAITGKIEDSILVFSTQNVGISLSQTITLTNSDLGSAILTAIVPPSSSAYSIDATASTCSVGLTLGAQDTCTVKIIFLPQSAGTFIDQISIQYTNPISNDVASISLSGIGVIPSTSGVQYDIGGSLGRGASGSQLVSTYTEPTSIPSVVSGTGSCLEFRAAYVFNGANIQPANDVTVNLTANTTVYSGIDASGNCKNPTTSIPIYSAASGYNQSGKMFYVSAVAGAYTVHGEISGMVETFDLSFSVVDVAPVAPSGLVATASSSSQVHLVWNDNSNNETNFKVSRSLDNSNFTDIATLPSNSTSYDDNGLTASTTYYYKVLAMSGALASSAVSANTNTLASSTGGPLSKWIPRNIWVWNDGVDVIGNSSDQTVFFDYATTHNIVTIYLQVKNEINNYSGGNSGRNALIRTFIDRAATNGMEVQLMAGDPAPGRSSGTFFSDDTEAANNYSGAVNWTAKAVQFINDTTTAKPVGIHFDAEPHAHRTVFNTDPRHYVQQLINMYGRVRAVIPSGIRLSGSIPFWYDDTYSGSGTTVDFLGMVCPISIYVDATHTSTTNASAMQCLMNLMNEYVLMDYSVNGTWVSNRAAGEVTYANNLASFSGNHSHQAVIGLETGTEDPSVTFHDIVRNASQGVAAMEAQIQMPQNTFNQTYNGSCATVISNVGYAGFSAQPCAFNASNPMYQRPPAGQTAGLAIHYDESIIGYGNYDPATTSHTAIINNY